MASQWLYFQPASGQYTYKKIFLKVCKKIIELNYQRGKGELVPRLQKEFTSKEQFSFE